MKALVLRKPWDVRAETVSDPRIEHARDVILRVTRTSICSVDLDVYAGRLPQKRPVVLGHEFTGVVEEVGPRVEGLRRGDRVVVPYAVACGDCFFCRRGLGDHCERIDRRDRPAANAPSRGAGIFGLGEEHGGYAGGQAQYVRVPFADAGPRKIPPELSDETAVFLGSLIPTGWAAAERCGLTGGETVAVFGCGPVGLVAMRAARLLGATRIIAVDPIPYRRQKARAIADAEALDPASDPAEAIRALTEGRGADACIDAVGLKLDHGLRETVSNVLHLQVAVAATVRAAVGAARRGGTVSVAGAVHSPADVFPLDEIFEKGLTVRSGRPLVHAALDRLLGMAASGRLTAEDLITHRMALDAGADAYDLLDGKREECLKVVLDPWAETARQEARGTAAADEVDALDDARYALHRKVDVSDTSVGAE